MATKAPTLKLSINKEDHIDLAIWKLMADRTGRTATDIADALHKYGFARELAVSRAKALMRRQWFERKEGKGGTKYVLKGSVPMPKPNNIVADENFMPTADELSQAPVMEERNPLLNINAEPEDYKAGLDNLLGGLMSGAPVNLYGEQNNYKVFPNIGDAISEEPAAAVVEGNRLEHKIDPEEGVLTCIWKTMVDFQEYTIPDIVMLLEAIGVKPSTTRLKFSEADKLGWFGMRTEKVNGRNTNYYVMHARIMMPIEDKPYRPRESKQGKDMKQENKQADLVDQASTQDDGVHLAQAVWDTIIENPNQTTSVICAKVEEKTGISAASARGMILDMAPKYLKFNQAAAGEASTWFIELGTPLPVEFGGKEPGSYGAGIKKVGRLTNPTALAMLSEKFTPVLSNIPQASGESSARRDLIASGVEKSLADITTTLSGGLPVQCDLSNIPQASGVPGPDRSQGETEMRLPGMFADITEKDVSDLELDLWTYLGLWSSDTEEGMISEMVKKHYDQADAIVVVSSNLMYFKRSFSPERLAYIIPAAIARSTITKEKIAAFKNNFHRQQREQLLDRINVPQLDNKETTMSTTQQQLHDQATVLIWTLAHQGYGTFHALREVALNTIDNVEHINQVWEENKKYLHMKKRGVDIGIMTPFGNQKEPITIEQINEFRARFDEQRNPLDAEVIKNITLHDGPLRAMWLLMSDCKKHFSHDVFDAMYQIGFSDMSVNAGREQMMRLYAMEEHKGIGGPVYKLDVPGEMPEPTMQIIDGIDPLKGYDHAIWKALSGGKTYVMSDLVNLLTKTGLNADMVRDRMMLLAGDAGYLEIDNGFGGMTFKLAEGAKEPKAGGKAEPVKTKYRVNPDTGFNYNLYKLLEQGAMSSRDVIQAFADKGWNADVVVALLALATKEGFTRMDGTAGMIQLMATTTEPKKRVDIADVKVVDGLAYSTWLLLSDRNLNTVEIVVDALSMAGFEVSRARDYVVQEVEKKDGLYETLEFAGSTAIRLKANRPAPAKEEPKEEERRGAPASSGFHSYEANAAQTKVPMQQADNQDESLVQVSITVAGMRMNVAQLVQLRDELRAAGYNHTAPWARSQSNRVLQSQHSINGKLFTESEVRQLAEEVSIAVSPMVSSTDVELLQHAELKRRLAETHRPGGRVNLNHLQHPARGFDNGYDFVSEMQMGGRRF